MPQTPPDLPLRGPAEEAPAAPRPPGQPVDGGGKAGAGPSSPARPYGLDWVATVPPTIALCREHYGADSAIVFGWVLGAHRVGAALVAYLGGLARDAFGTYDPVRYASGALCAVAALTAVVVRGKRRATA
ncbi:hypothetical protein GCM10010211_63270 [Streptomyces albospinus]|uniref:MFS transporter n=1 Tax=Streptomyces albospinus TaxID=285515 RepID=A0ABQ2VI76_9ACTN|nr:hypothetical protein GCM10010211_63270 [Streptomyces albospinus]